jgi:hypothetical protein
MSTMDDDRRMQVEDLNALHWAVGALEHPSLASRLGNLVGKPIELMRQALPPGASEVIARAATKGLNAAMTIALRTMSGQTRGGSPLLHRSLAAVSGAVGGGLGLAALALELPVSTVIMLRSIMTIAREQGEDIDNPETALASLQVFALGTRVGEGGDALGNGYFAVRGALAKSLTEAARFMAERGIVAEGAPVLVRFIAQVASRFGMVVTQKAAAQTLPLIGAVGGAAVNYAFTTHFQDIAQAHFTVRRLERRYGGAFVRTQYERIREGIAGRKFAT